MTDLPKRACIVCSTTYQPRRVDQIYDPDSDCENTVRRAELANDHLYHKALERQGYVCFDCGAKPGEEQEHGSERGKSLGLTRTIRLRPLVLTPTKLLSTKPLRAKDIAASCVECRRRRYQGLAAS